MELQLHLHPKNNYPLNGFFIKGEQPVSWFEQLQRSGLRYEDIELYPLPDTRPYSVWGCFVLVHSEKMNTLDGSYQLCQQACSNLFIPAFTALHPPATPRELEELFRNRCVMHPEFGLVELEEKLDPVRYIQLPAPTVASVITPSPSVKIPGNIKTFYVVPLTPEEVMKNLEEHIFPKQEKPEMRPLNPLEKLRLLSYRLLFSKGGKPAGNTEFVQPVAKKKWFTELLNKLTPQKNPAFIEKMERDFEQLEERNKKEVDKLLDMLRKNPEEALRYAIPLDQNGSSRGNSEGGNFTLDIFWKTFSLFGEPGSGRGGAVDLGDSFFELQMQYEAAAKAFQEKKQFDKAAFIYLRLLKNPFRAAECLREGGLYQEAAIIYLKHNNKILAAQTYEEGNMLEEALKLYKELNMHEHAGDLCVKMGKHEEANIHYTKTANDLNSNSKYIKASLIYKNKMHRIDLAQQVLKRGWMENRDASNCLNNYFNNINEPEHLKTEIESLYRNEVNERNRVNFLRALTLEFKKNTELAPHIKNIAYEIISEHAKTDVQILTELKEFNKKDRELLKDAMRFRVNRRRS